MSLLFRCPQCAKAYAAPERLAGKGLRCKACGLRMTVPFGSEIGLTDPEALDEEVAAARPPRPAFEGFPTATPVGGEGPSWGSKGWLGGLFAVAVIGFRIYAAFHRNHRGPANGAPPRLAPPAAVVPGQIDRLNAASFVMPPLPDRGPPREVEPGAVCEVVTVGPGRSEPGVPPAHGMTLWLYLPKPNGGAPAEGSLPCVLIAPAGGRLITGQDLSDEGDASDRPEHLPYVRAGFAVLAYSLDGGLGDGGPGRRAVWNRDLARASSAFLAARAGLSDARVALQWLREKVPEVDPGRVYAAGHSSAGTAALLLAENEPAIQGVAAFAPPSDLSAHFDAHRQQSLRRIVRGADEFFTTYNPAFHADRIKAPVFLFQARDDEVVSFSETESFAQRLRDLGKNVTLQTVPKGGHYQPMIDRGIPLAVAWLKGIDAQRKP